jgi:hypothetical protein
MNKCDLLELVGWLHDWRNCERRADDRGFTVSRQPNGHVYVFAFATGGDEPLSMFRANSDENPDLFAVVKAGVGALP